MEFILATNNAAKKDELSAILTNHRLLLPEDVGVQFSCEETGATYLENSLQKAQLLYNRVRRPVIADDSGLSVTALNGAPGIYSARYGSRDGKSLTAPERNRYLMEMMENSNDRSARFICCLVLMLDEYRIVTVQESVSGEILREPRGTGGFGYDPVFFLPSMGLTMAELSPEEKDIHSHRGKAGKRIISILKDNGGTE